jgi:oxepin-CoA hydrolase/3-oxo-5,6-dehydrosuberyl-CoA semialdehyde dehydrogenase
MKTIRSYVLGSWHEAATGFIPLIDPATEEECARASSAGIDFGAVLDHARDRGGPALRGLGFGERGQLLKDMSRVLREQRAELLELSRINTGTTVPDGAFDVDGATGTLAYYASLARTLGDRPYLAEAEEVALAKGDFWARHVLLPRRGAAVLVNAFNFPVWGFAEKAACALLAGMPVIVKPATATAMVTERAVEVLIEARILPEGALQLICGSPGDLLDWMGAHDVLAFTGSAATARTILQRSNLSAANTRINIEADSLNAAVLAPDAAEGTTLDLFVRDVVREITQKTGQKCTAVRRIFVPTDAIANVEEALTAKLGAVVTGNAADPEVTMGPLCTRGQLEDALSGLAALSRATRRVTGSGSRVDGRGSPPGRGFFLAPTLLRADDARSATAVHEREIFGPVATLMPYDGSATDATALVRLGGGMLVTSVYSDDERWLGEYVAQGGNDAGRLYIGSRAAADAAPGSGVAFPHALHGGPGRAGGGAELGGTVGLQLYMQRIALQGARSILSSIAGAS